MDGVSKSKKVDEEPNSEESGEVHTKMRETKWKRNQSGSGCILVSDSCTDNWIRQ